MAAGLDSDVSSLRHQKSLVSSAILRECGASLDDAFVAVGSESASGTSEGLGANGIHHSARRTKSHEVIALAIKVNHLVLE